MATLGSAALLLQAALVLQQAGVAEAGAGEDPWWQAAHEFAFIETCLLLALIPIAYVFDLIWHSLRHYIDRAAYVYGAGMHKKKRRLESEEDIEGHFASHPHDGHKTLLGVLLHRMGTEFMTLGFLAIVIFMCENHGLFKFVAKEIQAKCEFSGSEGDHGHRRLGDAEPEVANLDGVTLYGPDACFPVPTTGTEWFHMAEIVHFSLFAAMCLYFVQMFALVMGSASKMSAWEAIRDNDVKQNFQRKNAPPRRAATALSQKLGHLPLEAEYRGMQEKFVHFAVANVDVQREIVQRAQPSHINGDHEHMLRQALTGSNFDFSAYLSFEVETAVSESIEVHSATWLSIWVYLLISCLWHRFSNVTFPEMVVIVIPLPTLVWFGSCLWLFKKQQDGLAEHKSKLETTPSWFLRARRLLRVAQVVSIIYSYVLARLLFAPPDWTDNPNLTLLCSLIVSVMWIGLLLWLAFHAPTFLAHMSLPPYFNAENAKAMHSFRKAFNPEYCVGIRFSTIGERAGSFGTGTGSVWQQTRTDLSNNYGFYSANVGTPSNAGDMGLVSDITVQTGPVSETVGGSPIHLDNVQAV